MKNETADMLSKIFAMQTDLNDYVFKKNGIVDNQGETLTMAAIFNGVNNKQLKVNELPNRWLGNYSRAMREEIDELDQNPIRFRIFRNSKPRNTSSSITGTKTI